MGRGRALVPRYLATTRRYYFTGGRASDIVLLLFRGGRRPRVATPTAPATVPATWSRGRSSSRTHGPAQKRILRADVRLFRRRRRRRSSTTHRGVQSWSGGVNKETRVLTNRFVDFSTIYVITRTSTYERQSLLRFLWVGENDHYLSKNSTFFLVLNNHTYNHIDYRID